MSALSAFTQWNSLVRERIISSPEKMINLAARQDYALSPFISNRPMGDVLRTGKYLTERVKLSVGGNFGKFIPGSTHTSSRTTTSATLSWQTCTYRNSYPVTEAEFLFADTNDQAVVFKNFRKAVEQDLVVAHWEGLEDLLFARPASATMESVTIQNGDCYSLLAYISENTSTWLPPSTVWSASTVAQLSPATYSNWRPAQRSYDSSNPSHPTSGVFSAFGKACNDINFTAPSGAKTGDAYNASGIEKLMIWTNADGQNVYSDLLRSGQDSFRGSGSGSDPAYMDPMYYGKRVRKARSLTDNLLDESAGAYTGNAYPAGKARYFFVNGNHTFMAFHAKKMMQRYDKDGGSRQPDTQTFFMESYVQLLCNARNRNAVVYPA